MQFAQLQRTLLVQSQLLKLLVVDVGRVSQLRKEPLVLVVESHEVGVVSSDVEHDYLIGEDVLRKLFVDVEDLLQKLQDSSCQLEIEGQFEIHFVVSLGFHQILVHVNRLVVAGVNLEILIKESVRVGEPKLHLVQNCSDRMLPVLLFTRYWLHSERILRGIYEGAVVVTRLT